MHNIAVNFSVFFMGFFLISGYKTKEHVQRMVFKKISEFGDDLTLLCYLNKTSENQEETFGMRWYKEPDHLCSINEQTTDSTKYTAWVDDEGAKLTILNFDHEDLNQTYYCEIGFQKSIKLFLSKENVFQDQRLENDLSKNTEKPANHLIPVLIIIVVIAGVLTTIFGWFLRKLLCKTTCPRNTDLGEQRECLAHG